MRFLILLPLLVLVYAALQFGVLKFLEKRKGGDSLRKVGIAGMISGFKVARDFALIATLVYVALAILIFAYGALFGSNASFLLRLVQFGQLSASSLKGSRKILGNGAFVVVTLGLIYLSFIHRRKYLVMLFRRRYDQDLWRAQKNQTAKDSVPDSDTAKRLQAEIKEARLAFETLSEVSGSASKDWQSRQDLLRRIKSLEDQLAAERQSARLAQDCEPAVKTRGPWYRRFAMIFISKGLYSDLKLSARIVSWMASSAVALSLIAITGPGLSAAVWERMLHLDDLRVAAVKADIKNQIELAQGPAPATLTPEDVQAVQYLRAQFSRALVNNAYWSFSLAPDPPNVGLRQETTARSILKRVQVPGNNSPAASSVAEGLNGLSEADAKVVRAVADSEGVTHSAQKAISQDAEVVSWFGDKWTNVRSKLLAHAAKYGQPVEFSDVRGALIDKVVGMSFDESMVQADDIISKTASDILKSTAKESVKQAVDIEFKQAVVDLRQGAPFDDVLVKVRTKPIAIPVRQTEAIAFVSRNLDERALMDRLHRSGFGLRVPPDPGVNGPEAESAAQDIARMAGKHSSEPVADEVVAALDDYDHFFPPTNEQIPPDANQGGSGGGGGGGGGGGRGGGTDTVGPTISSDVPNKGPGGAGGGVHPSLSASRVVSGINTELNLVSSTARSLAPSPQFSVARAHSFSMLRGYSRVGGVLIGREPKPSSKVLNFNDLRWEVSGRQYTVVLVRSDGSQFRFGPYDRSLVHQALAYAADGRPLAVTMTLAAPLAELKILLHPALVDTPLGCRVIDIDRWVDVYARKENPVLDEQNKQTEDLNALYQVAWAERRLKLLGKLEKLPKEREWASQMREETTATAESAAELYRDSSKLPDSSLILDRKRSLISAKPEFFDAELVQWITDCVEGRTLDRFRLCIAGKADSALHDLDSAAADRWIPAPPKFELWSGVRELEYDTCADLSCFMTSGKSGNARLWPFDFMLQAAFTSPPAFLPDQPGQIQTEYVDHEPFEFPEIRANIIDHVSEALKNDSGMQERFTEIRDFTILQRLFRVALRGDLGPDFPLERLVSLTEASAGNLPSCATTRWNLRPGRLELAVLSGVEDFISTAEESPQLADGSTGELPRLLSQARSCNNLPRRVAGLKQGSDVRLKFLFDSLTDEKKEDLVLKLAGISTEEWNTACGFVGASPALLELCKVNGDPLTCAGARLTLRFEHAREARRLRKALGVPNTASPNNECVPLAGLDSQVSR